MVQISTPIIPAEEAWKQIKKSNLRCPVCSGKLKIIDKYTGYHVDENKHARGQIVTLCDFCALNFSLKINALMEE